MIAFQQSIRTLITAFIVFFIYQYFKLPEGYWLILSGLLLAQVYLKDLFWKNIFLIFISGMIIALNVFVANFAAENMLVLAFYLFFTTFITVYVGLFNATFLLTAFFINLLGTLSAGLNVDDGDIVARVGWVLLGTFIAMLVRIVFWPPRIKQELKRELDDCLSLLNELQKDIFLIYLNRDYLDKHYAYEIELHQKRMQILAFIQTIRSLSIKKAPAAILAKKCLGHVTNIYEIIIALGNLRYRVKDHTTFEVCEKELKKITDAISSELTDLAKHKSTSDLSKLLSGILEFEEVYRSTLILVGSDPIVYLISIRNLYALHDELKLLADDMREI